MFRKYLCYLGDTLTGSEIALALALFLMAVFQRFSNAALWIFVLAELCDAADGPCARKWPYTDNKPRLRRTYVTQIEHGSDIFLLASCMLYLLRYPNPLINQITLGGGVFVIFFCIVIEGLIRTVRSLDDLSIDTRSTVIRRYILIRRYVYLAGIAVGVALLIFSTTYPLPVKLIFCAIGIIAGFVIYKLKPDRAHNP